MGEPVEMIRGWLCEIPIARGDFDSVRLESLKDRGDLSHTILVLNERGKKQFLDWRRISLQRRS